MWMLPNSRSPVIVDNLKSEVGTNISKLETLRDAAFRCAINSAEQRLSCHANELLLLCVAEVHADDTSRQAWLVNDPTEDIVA